ncbi:protein of unknown function [Allopseudospirillum japonicum]|uniref:DUF4340 domain-containing protein n=1 Tax=Allopseudospirillum japonicum TaxID=64971 RepID=A0A1H6SLR4_9GAMM|nr:DUF4340 domain-containing protein [Allopseudospirillum japonicum]SEI67866.1 protein of unknown function [Allopseudospirillum japonicum]
MNKVLSFPIWQVGVFIALIGAGIFALQRQPPQVVSAEKTLLHPLIPEQIERIHIQTTEVISLYRDLQAPNPQWRLQQRAGYLAQADDADRLLHQLSQARILDIKTQDTNEYAHFGVAMPAQDLPVQIQVFSRQGPVLDVLLGYPSAQGQYARFTAGKEVYLLDQVFEVPTRVAAWLEPHLVDIPAANVHQILYFRGEQTQPHLHLQRPEDGAPLQVLLPKKETKLDTALLEGLAMSLSQLQLEDVARQAPQQTSIMRIRFITWDGLILDVKVYQGGWIHLQASTLPETEPVAGAKAHTLNQAWQAGYFLINPYAFEQLLQTWDKLQHPQWPPEA